MLKNVHLAPGWLMQLEKKLHSLQPHACFRLFLTMEINPKVGGAAGAAPPPSAEPAAETVPVTGALPPAGAREPAPRGPHLRVRAAPGGEGQHAEDLQQRPRLSDLQGGRRGACPERQPTLGSWAAGWGLMAWILQQFCLYFFSAISFCSIIRSSLG